LNSRWFIIAFLLCITIAHAATAQVTTAATQDSSSSVGPFLVAWVAAWNTHDTDALMRLDADDCVHINAGGRLFLDKKATSQHIKELLNGEHKDSQFPPLRLLYQRTIAPGLIVLQAAWQSPSPDAKEMTDMLFTFTLKRSGSGWLAEQVDAHDVEDLAPVRGETVVFSHP
jgi:hypothetical protein